MKNFFINHYGKASNDCLKINSELNPIIEKYNGFLGHGIALKLIRENKLPDNQDLDYDLYNVKDVDELISEMNNLGYELFARGKHKNIDKFLTFFKDDAYIDFFLCDVDGNTFDIHTICCETIFPKFKLIDGFFYSDKFISYSRKMTYTEIEKKVILNNLFFLPKNYDLYFSEMYGKDWREPKPYFNWSLNPSDNMPKKLHNNQMLISPKNYEINFK